MYRVIRVAPLLLGTVEATVGSGWHVHCPVPLCVHVLLCQVVVSLAGNVTFEGGVSMQCPTGTNFLDSFGGLYDRGAFPVQTTACSNSAVNSLVLASSLQFVCAR